MPSLLQQLENNEAVLQMYLADELPADDRVEVEQMLATDPGLRAVLEDLRLAQDLVIGSLRKLDQATPLAVSTPVAARQMSRLIKQWQVDRLARQAAAPPKRKFRLPAWAYSAATAAAVLVAVVVWWGMKSDVPSSEARRDDASQGFSFEDDPSFQVVRSLVNQEDIGSPGINDAEQEASALARSDDTSSILSFESSDNVN
jgi:anti-sigma factor RsiW